MIEDSVIKKAWSLSVDHRLTDTGGSSNTSWDCFLGYSLFRDASAILSR